jgi:hypothetical protein
VAFEAVGGAARLRRENGENVTRELTEDANRAAWRSGAAPQSGLGTHVPPSG